LPSERFSAAKQAPNSCPPLSGDPLSIAAFRCTHACFLAQVHTLTVTFSAQCNCLLSSCSFACLLSNSEDLPPSAMAAADPPPRWKAAAAACAPETPPSTPRICDWRAADPQYVRLDDEDGLMRPYWMIPVCPLKGCSPNSWTKVRCFSFVDAGACLDKLKAHAMASSHHKFDEENAQGMIDDPEIIGKVLDGEETREKRQEYRDWADKQFAKEVQQEKHRSKGKGKGGKSAAPASIIASKRSQDVVELDILQGPSMASSSSRRGGDIMAFDARSMKRRVENDAMVTISWRQCELLRDSLRRARDSALNSQALTKQLSDQFGQEARVVEVAFQCVEEVLRESSRM
jgi:hypothetical protein